MINGYLQKNHDIQIEQLATYYLLVLRFQYFSIEYITHLDWIFYSIDNRNLKYSVHTIFDVNNLFSLPQSFYLQNEETQVYKFLIHLIFLNSYRIF